MNRFVFIAFKKKKLRGGPFILAGRTRRCWVSFPKKSNI